MSLNMIREYDNINYIIMQDEGSNEGCYITGCAEKATAGWTLDLMTDNHWLNKFSYIIIGNEAFSGDEYLEKVIISPNTISIQADAFAHCTSLETLEFPCKVVDSTNFDYDSKATLTFTRGCFKDCNNLHTIKYLTFDENSNSFLGFIFGANSPQEQASFVPESLTTITVVGPLLDNCCLGCKYLKDVFVTDITTATIPCNAFYDCYSLERFVVKTMVELLDDTTLTSVPAGLLDLSGITYINDCAFFGCYKLDTVYISKEFHKFGVDCFRDCFGITKIINDTAYTNVECYIQLGSTDYGCLGLYALLIEKRKSATDHIIGVPDSELDNVITIEDQNILVKLPKLPETYTVQDGKMGLDCNSIRAESSLTAEDYNTVDPAKITHIKSYVGYKSNLEFLILPDSLIETGDFIFQDSVKLTELTIPKPWNKSGTLTGTSYTLKSFGRGVFKNCPIQTLRYGTDYSKEADADKTELAAYYHQGCLSFGHLSFAWPQYIFQDVKAVFIGPQLITCEHTDDLNATSILDLAVPTGHTFNLTLAFAHFFDKVRFKKPSTPADTITTLPKNMFYGCERLTHIIDESDSSGNLFGASALPAYIEVIKENAFYDCKSLQYDADALTNHHIKRLGNWIFGVETDSLEMTSARPETTTCSIIVADTGLHFYDDAFKNCSALETIRLMSDDSAGYIESPETKIARVQAGWLKSTFNTIFSNPFYINKELETSITTRKLLINESDSDVLYDFDIDTLDGTLSHLNSYTFSGMKLNSVKFTNSPRDAAFECKQIAPDTFKDSSITDVTCLPSMLEHFKNIDLQTVTVQPFVDYNKHLTDTEIFKEALVDCYNITTLTIKSCRIIGTPAVGLNTIYTGLSRVYADAFKGCTKLSTIYFDGDFTSTPFGTPEYTSSWTQIIFDNEYANPVYAYTQNGTLSLNIGSLNMLAQEEIILKDNIIKPYTLARFSANKIAFENDLQYIDPKAFVRCSNLKAIVAPGEAEQLESSDYMYKYYNGSYYTTVNIMTGDAENVTNEGVYIIRKSDATLICGLGTVLAIAEQLDIKAVEDYACYQNTALNTVILSKNIEDIGFNVFGGCSNLKNLTLPFVGKLKDFAASTGHFMYIFGARQYDQVNNVAAPSGITLTLTGDNIILNNQSFYGCANIVTKLYIPGQIQRLDHDPFSSLAEVPDFYDITEDEKYTYISTAPNGDPKILISMADDISILESATITHIYANACKNNTTLTKIKCNNLKGIGDYACSNCTNLETLQSDTITQLGDYALAGTTFSKLSTPNLQYAGDYCLDKSSVTTLELPAGLLASNVTDTSFEGIENLQVITLPTWLTGCISKTRLREVTFNAGTSINNSAFYRCTGLRKVKLADGDNIKIQTIGSNAFSECYSLNCFPWDEIKETCTQIGSQAFKSCWNLYTVTVPNNLTVWTEYSTVLKRAYFDKFITTHDIIEQNTLLQNPSNTFKLKSNQTAPLKMRFLSNKAAVAFYELDTEDDYNIYRQVGLETYIFDPDKTYMFSLLPSATFPSNEAEAKNGRAIDLRCQIYTLNEHQEYDWVDAWTTSTDDAVEDSVLAEFIDIQSEKWTTILSTALFDVLDKDEYEVVTTVKYQDCSQIGTKAFADCYKLYRIINDNTNLEITTADFETDNFGGLLYNAKELLTTKDLAKSALTTLDNGFVCYPATTINFDNGYELLTNIGDLISSVTLPNGISVISAYTFIYDDVVQSVKTNPDMAVSISDYAFYECSVLETLDTKLTDALAAEACYKCPKYKE